MKKISLLIVIFLLLPLSVLGITYPKLDSKKVEVYDLTDDKVLYEIGSNDKTYIASLTKIATTITAIENIKNLDDKVVITSNILKTVEPIASVAGLKNGDIVTYRDLLYATMLPSGADAANALAILISGNISNFVNIMNDLVKRIGLNNTHFVNVTGLDTNNHYSSISDLRKLLVYALNNSLFRDIYTTKNYKLTNGLKVKSTLYKYTDGTNLDISKIIGSKSGLTDKAGYSLSSLSNIYNHQIIIILVGASKKGIYCYNIVDSLNLIDFLNNNYNNQILINKDDIVKSIPVKLSNIDNYDIRVSNDIKKFLPNDYDKSKFDIKYNGLEELSYKNKLGDMIGTINYYYDGQLISEEKVYVNKNINVNLFKWLINYYYVIIIVIILLFAIIYIFIKHQGYKLKIFNKKKLQNN